jgi:hypothetical protein
MRRRDAGGPVVLTVRGRLLLVLGVRAGRLAEAFSRLPVAAIGCGREAGERQLWELTDKEGPRLGTDETLLVSPT